MYQICCVHVCVVPIGCFDFRNLDKLTNLTTLNLSKTGVSCNIVVTIVHASIDSLSLSLSLSLSQRDFTNTPHLDKLIHLTDIDMSYNDLTRSKLDFNSNTTFRFQNTCTCMYVEVPKLSGSVFCWD